MTVSPSECPRCGEAVYPNLVACSLCGSANPYWTEPSSEVGRLAWGLRQGTKPLLERWRHRYGLVPITSLAGVLPFYPVTPVIGIVAGSTGLYRSLRGVDPHAGRWLALTGFVGGVFWLVAGIVLTTRAARLIQNAPFIPEPIKWFWTWGVAG